MYEGTGIGSLYRLSLRTVRGRDGEEYEVDPHAWQLAGWNIRRSKGTGRVNTPRYLREETTSKEKA
jgi:hypothetical protein